MNELMLINYKLLGLCIFRNILKDKAIDALIGCFAYSTKSLSEAVVYYSNFLKILYESEFRDDFTLYLNDLIKHDENIFTVACANGEELSESIINSAKVELETLKELSQITSGKIKEILKAKFADSDVVVNILGEYKINTEIVNFNSLSDYVKTNCFGDFAKFGAFYYDRNNTLIPVKNTDTTTLCDLKEYDAQKKKLVDNTFTLISGKGANNILLYGDRGCGKSSSVKAVYNEFKDKGLKIVQILKQDLVALNKLLERLSKIPAKFIVFIDDLSFSQEDENLSAVKSALEGAIAKRNDNIVIYATTNRRNIIKETFSSRAGNEVHMSDTIEENASLSDRFGITLTFLAPNKDIYLEIARKIAQDKACQITPEFNMRAERFALLKGSRSPRVAQQFVLHYMGQN